MSYRKEAAKLVSIAVTDGTLEVREDGSIWRLRSAQMRGTLPRRVDKLRPDGYRRVTATIDGRAVTALAHRVVYLHMSGGLLARNRVVNHMNGDRGDNRPENLEKVTVAQNTQHCVDVLGRQLGKRGTEHHNARINPSIVGYIRRRQANGEHNAQIATAYGISLRQTQRIASGDAWAHI